MRKFSKFTVVVPALYSIVLMTAPAANADLPWFGSKASEKAASEVAQAVSKSASDEAVDGISQFFRESASARYVMTNTEEGRQLLGVIISKPEAQISGRSYNAFLDRIEWQANRPIRNELYARLRQLDDDFNKFRSEKGEQGKARIGEALSPAETQFIESEASKIIKNDELKAIFDHRTDFVKTPQTGYAQPQAQSESPATSAAGKEGHGRARAKPANGSDSASTQQQDQGLETRANGAANDAAIPARPAEQAPIQQKSNIELAKTASSAVSVLQDPGVKAAGGAVKQLSIKLRTIGGFFKFMRLSDGDWRSLLGLGGQDFSPNDLLMIRKLNRLMGTLNSYAKTRLTIQAFSLQSPGLYNQVNAKTLEATKNFLAGELGEQAYLDARAAAVKEAGMDDVVNQAETRMIQQIDQTRGLGGSATNDAEGIIPKKEAEVKIEEQKLVEKTAVVEKARKELAAAGTDAEKAEAQKKLDMAIADRDLSTTRVKSASDQLKAFYWQFIQNYEPIEIYKNLRNGLINSDPVQAFDLPDSMVVNEADYQEWGKIYQRALNEVAGTGVKDEVVGFFKGKVYKTRDFISELNDDTGKLFGTKFLDSQYGTEFKSYGKGVIVNALQKMALFILPPAIGEKVISDRKPMEAFADNVIGKMVNFITSKDDKSDDKKKSKDDSSEDDSSKDDSKDSGKKGGKSDAAVANHAPSEAADDGN